MKSKKQEIEQEYQEPLIDILLGYASQGESVSATAAILGLHRHTLLRWVDSLGIRDKFPTRGFSNGHRAAIEYRQVNRKACSEGMKKAMTDRYGFWFEGVFDTRLGHAKRKELNISTVRHRIDSGWSIEKAMNTKPKAKNRP